MAKDYPSRSRLPDWEQRLFDFLNEARTSDFAWGRNDCAVGLVNGAVKAQTGVDLGSPHIGQYGDEKAAFRYMRDNGWGRADLDVSERLTAMMDNFLRRENNGRRHRGNIILIESLGGTGFGVRVSSLAYAFHPENGLALIPIPRDALEWKVT